MRKKYQFKRFFIADFKALLFCLCVVVSHSKVHAKTITLACIDCFSSFSLAPEIAAQIAAGANIKWILIRTFEYRNEHKNSMLAFPNDSEEILMDPQNGTEPPKSSLSSAEVAEYLKSQNVAYVFGGTDKGAHASPLLNGPLGFPDNPLASRDSRIIKNLMTVTAGKNYGIPTLELTDVDAAMQWIAKLPQKEIILKLNSGAGGDFLKFLSKDDLPKLRDELATHIGEAKNVFSEKVHFIVQPKIVGRKFFANTYTFEGKTYLTSVAEYHMIEWNGTIMYCFDEFLDLNSPEANKLRAAVEELNPKFEVIHGPAHPEFILDELTNEFQLIEMNARVAGAGVPGIEREVYGISHLDLHLLSVLDPKRLRKELAKFPRHRKKRGVIFFAPSPANGKLNARALARIKKHKSYFLPGSHYELKGNSPVVENKDQSTSAGVIYFVGDTKTVSQGLDLAVQLFDSGDLIDFAQPLPREMQSCHDARISVKKNQLSNQIRAARSKIRF